MPMHASPLRPVEVSVIVWHIPHCSCGAPAAGVLACTTHLGSGITSARTIHGYPVCAVWLPGNDADRAPGAPGHASDPDPLPSTPGSLPRPSLLPPAAHAYPNQQRTSYQPIPAARHG